MTRSDEDCGSVDSKKRKCPEPCWSPTCLGWTEGGGQQTETGPGQALIELATGQVRNLWEGQKGLRVKGVPGPALPFFFQGGQGGEGAGSLQPGILSEEEKSQTGCPMCSLSPYISPALIFPPHPPTFWSGQ